MRCRAPRSPRPRHATTLQRHAAGNDRLRPQAKSPEPRLRPRGSGNACDSSAGHRNRHPVDDDDVATTRGLVNRAEGQILDRAQLCDLGSFVNGHANSLFPILPIGIRLTYADLQPGATKDRPCSRRGNIEAVTTTLSDNPGPHHGAYGLRIEAPSFEGLIDRSHLVEAQASWPAWEIGWETLVDQSSGDTPVVESWSPDHATLAALPSGFITIDRAAARTTLHLPDAPTAATILHPYLASTGVVAGHWLGRAPFHAGAFVHGGRAWGVLGAKEMGKTSLLMCLHRSGVPVLADDVLVVEGRTAYSGPRCLDLRQSAAERFEAGEYLGVVGGRATSAISCRPPSCRRRGCTITGGRLRARPTDVRRRSRGR